MVKTYQCAFPLNPGEQTQIQVSNYIELGVADNTVMGILKFTCKNSANFENLIYFCGGYLDPQTRDYYVCPHRMDAIFPLFMLDEAVPANTLLNSAAMMCLITALSPSDKTVFESVWYDNTAVSIVREVDYGNVIEATIDAIIKKRMLLNSLLEALVPHLNKHPVPAENWPNYSLFIENLDQAKQSLTTYMMHWTTLEMLDVYSKKVNKKLAALLNFSLFEKVHGRLDYSDRELLMDLWEQQCDGSLEDDALLDEDEE